MSSSWNSSWDPERGLCRLREAEVLVYVWTGLYVLLLPLFVCVLFIGFRLWKKRRAPPPHSDDFTFNIVAMETMSLLGSGLFSLSFQVKTRALSLVSLGNHFLFLGFSGQTVFHCLTCVERHLAVVRPVTYLRLKERGGVTLRNVAVAMGWVFSVAMVILQHVTEASDSDSTLRFMLALSVAPLALVVFCSVSVLRVLIRPGPGDGGGASKRVDQSKRRAFVMICAIAAALLLRLVVMAAVYGVLVLQPDLSSLSLCALRIIPSYFIFPSSAVAPLMFLLRHGTLATRKRTESS